ncbi:MAG: Gfo/Idh/MocA family oxidoreductase, partial [Lentisphaeria bacterium]|nr:Gfo/Idh/MocA family oxidoreductase [Lentisphaeria bacterium]
REGFLGGGCHALDLARFLAGDPEEVFCYMNKKHHPEWPKPDSGFAVARFPEGVIGRIFVSTGVKRPYTMRTVINGTKGTIICDNTSDTLQISEEGIYDTAGKVLFTQIPVLVSSHNVRSELEDFAKCILAGTPCPTNEIQGLKTVAFAEAAIKSNLTNLPVKVDYSVE